MPKISESGGPTYAGVTSTPTEAQYSDAMSRHGTEQWTAEDQRVKDLWDNRPKGEEKERGEDESAGNSSSASSASQRKNSDRTVIEPPSPAPTTANPSSEAPKENSSARQTGGSGTGSKGK